MRLEAAKKVLGWVPERHSIDEVENFTQRMKKLEYSDPNHPSILRIIRDPTPAEKRFIRNEIQMCACDADYFLTRYCNPPEAPIWMGDGSFKPIGDVCVGDKVIGWNRDGNGFSRYGALRERYAISEVIATARRWSPIVRVVLESGASLRCTPDHLWSSGLSTRSRKPWIEARVGRHLRKVTDVYSNTPASQDAASWLSGIFDGEGSGCYISQSPTHNPDVYFHIANTLQSLGFGPVGLQKEGIYMGNSYANLMKFLLWCKPIRADSVRKYMYKHPHMRTPRDKIVSVTPDGYGEVVSMQTTTGNYVVWGYASKNCFIRDETNTIRRFQWRIPQQAAFAVIKEMEEQNRSIEMQWLKGRQLGISTIIELLTTHRALFGYGISAVVASVDKDKSEKMAGMIWLCVNQCPWWIRPTEDQNKVGKLLSFMNQCSISIQSGNQMSGIARGSTPTCIHLSEIADYPDPGDLIEASLFRAVHPSPKVFMHLESTGNSNVGWWAETWRFNKANWHRGMARLRPVFLPWYMGVDIYPMPTWLHDHPIPSGWRPMNETVAHIQKCNAYTRNTVLLSKLLGAQWTLPTQQAWFWEVNYLEHKAKRIEKKWLQEMPADDYEALQSRQEKIFPYEVLTRLETERDKVYDVYALVGEGIEDKFYPMDTEIDYSLPRIPLSWTGRGKTYRWHLIPLKIQDVENTDANKWNTKLFVYKYPEVGKRYSVGIDTAGGGGADRTVLSVDEVNEGTMPDEQACELASDQISAAESYAFAMALCSWYDAYMVACEQIRKPGDICQLQMKQMGWPNSRVHSFVRYDGKKVQKGKATKKGWYTTAWSRPLLLSMFIAAVENGWYKVNSKFLVEECDNFEARYTDSGMTRMEHQQGKHDDRLFSAAISYFISHDLSLMIERSKKRYAAPSQRLPELVMGECVMNSVPFEQFYGKRYPGMGVARG